MREIVHIQAGQCGNQIGAKVSAKLIGKLSQFEEHAKKNGDDIDIFSSLTLFFFWAIFK